MLTDIDREEQKLHWNQGLFTHQFSLDFPSKYSIEKEKNKQIDCNFA